MVPYSPPGVMRLLSPFLIWSQPTSPVSALLFAHALPSAWNPPPSKFPPPSPPPFIGHILQVSTQLAPPLGSCS